MAVFLSDAFTGADNTLLDAHSPETGGTWVKYSGDGSNDFRITGNRLRPAGAAGAEYYNNTIAPDADVNVTVNMDYVSDQNFFMSWGARFTTTMSDDDGVVVAWDDFANLYRLTEYVNGAENELDQASLTHADQEIRLELIGTAAKVYVDDVEIMAGTTAVTAAGYVGVTKFGGPGSADGAMFLDMVAETIEAAAGASQRFLWDPRF